MKFRRKLKLVDQFFLTFSILIIIPLIILFGYTYTKMSYMIRENTIASTNVAFNQSCSFISYKIDRLYDTANSLIIDNNITSILINNPKDYSIPNQIEDLQLLRSYIYSYQHNIDISDIEIYLNDDFIYSNEKVNIFPLSSLANSKWLSITKDLNVRYFWAPYSYISDKNEDSVVLGKCIVNPKDYTNPIGYLFIKFNTTDLTDIITKTNSNAQSFSCIVNSYNDVIATTDNTLYSKYKNIIENTIPQNDTSLHKYKYDSDDIYVQSSSIDKTDWKIVNIVPYSTINSEITNQRICLILIVILFGGAALIAGYKFFNSITSRLYKVIEGMRHVHADNLDNFIENDKDDELGELIENYNYMISKMSGLIEEQYKYGKAVKNAELKALQSQINPHFLYNTLDMINWMAYKKRTSEISTAVKSLAKFYKLSLNKGKDITYISDEIGHVSLYVQIQNMRYSNRITLTVDIDKNINNYLIPKITLQPIVENSISHGIFAKGNVSGLITISGYIDMDNDEILIKVSDDGIGIEEDKLQLILSPNQISYKGSGYGLRNIDQRLKLLFGDKFGLSFESIYGCGTTVIIKIPLITDDNYNDDF